MALNLGPLNVLLNLKGARQFTQGANQATSAISSLGQSIAGLVGIHQLTSAFVEATQVFAEFERGMVRVGAVTNSLGSTAFAGLTERAQELARTTEFTGRQVADAMGFMGMAGMSTNQIFDATPAVLQLASAGMIDVAKAADVVTNIMAGYGMETKDLTKANNILVATFTGSNTSLESLGQSFKYAGSVAKNAGVDFREAAAVIGLMGNAGIQADMAGTALRGAIIKLLKPTSEGADIMRRYGINVLDSSGKLKSMVEIFRQFEPIADDSAALVELFGLRAGPGLQAALGQGTEALEKLIDKIDNAGNIAERIAEAQLDTLDGKIKIMKSNFEALQIAIGNAFKDETRMMVGGMATVFGDLADAISGATGNMTEFGTEANATLRNLIRSFSFGMLEGVTPDEGLTGAAGAGLAALEERNTLEKKISANQFSQEEHLKATGRLNMDLVKQAADLAMQWEKVNERIVSAGRGMREAGKAGLKAPVVETPKAAATPIETAAAVITSQVTSRLVGVMDIGTDMLQDELDQFMASFEPEIVIDFADAVSQAGDAAMGFSDAALSLTSQIAQGVAFGNLGAQFGAEIGGAVGSAIGNAIAPGIGGAAGSAIGSVLGQLMGRAFDELIEALGVLTPVFDLLANIISTMQQPLLVLGAMLEVVGKTIFAVLGPPLELMFGTLAKVLYPVAALFQALSPILVLFGHVMSVVMMPLAFVIDLLAAGLVWLTDNAVIPVARVFVDVYNVLVDFVNGITESIRGIEIFGARPFEHFGVTLDKMEMTFTSYSDIVDKENEARAEATESLKEFNEELTNVPIGVKRLRALQYNATRGAAAFPGRFTAPAFGA